MFQRFKPFHIIGNRIMKLLILVIISRSIRTISTSRDYLTFSILNPALELIDNNPCFRWRVKVITPGDYMIKD